MVMMRVYRVFVSAVGNRLEDERMDGGGRFVSGKFRFDVGAISPADAAEEVSRRLTFGVERREFGSGGPYLTSDMVCRLGTVVWVGLSERLTVDKVHIRHARYTAQWGSITGVDDVSRLVVEVSEDGYSTVLRRRREAAGQGV